MADVKISALSAVAAVDGAEEFAVNNGGVSEKVTTDQIAEYSRTYGTTISPAQITSDQDDYTPTGFSSAKIIRLDGDSGFRAITGFAAGVDGERKDFWIVGSYPIYIPQDHPDSSAANRVTGHPGDFIGLPGKRFSLTYDGTSSRWRIEGEYDLRKANSLTYEWSAGSVAGGDYGDVVPNNAGGGTSTALAATATLPAANQLSTSTSSSGAIGMYFAKSTVSFSAFAAAHIYAEAYISIPTLSTAGERYLAELQITSSASSSGEDNNSINLRYSDNVNGGEWELFSQDNTGTETVADTDIPVAAATLYRVALYIDKAKTEARVYINGTYAGRVTGTMPNSVACGAKALIVKSAGTTARQLNVHSFNAGAIYT